jgi:CRISPR/Cas system CSM-associated protein Csm2 small subunit
MTVEEITKKLESEKQFAIANYQDLGDTYFQGRRDLADELLDMIEGEDKDAEEIQSLKDFMKAWIAQNKIDTGELKR